MYLLLSLLVIQIFISVFLWMYNKNFKIEFSIKGFKEEYLIVNNHKICFYEKEILNNSNQSLNNIVFIHSPFESSFNSNLTLENQFNISNDLNNNYKIILIDLPAHGNSFKDENYDYSFRNVSSDLINLINSLNLNEINLICDKFSSSIGLNMILLNDKIFSKLILIDPIFKYNSHFQNTKLPLKNNFLRVSNFLKLNFKKDSESLENYVASYFNNKHSSNKYSRKIISQSIPLSIKDISSNINIFSLITNPYYFKSSYLKELSNNSSTTFFIPKNQNIQNILKK